jgi:hypothetical protein
MDENDCLKMGGESRTRGGFWREVTELSCLFFTAVHAPILHLKRNHESGFAEMTESVVPNGSTPKVALMIMQVTMQT